MCPDESTLAAYVDAALGKSEVKKIEEHLNACEPCMELVFFLKKAMSREAVFSQKKENRLVLALKNMGLVIKEKLGAFETRPIELAFRNDNIRENRVELELANTVFEVYHSASESFITPKTSAELELQKKSGRVLFSGFCKAGQALKLDEKEPCILKIVNQSVELEVTDV